MATATKKTTTVKAPVPAKTATFGNAGQYTYKVDSKGTPYGAPTATKATTAPSTNLYNTNTGARLNSGESYTNAQGQKVTQGTSIDANIIGNTSQLNLPTAPAPKDQNGTLIGASTGQVNPLFGITTDQNGIITVKAPKPEETPQNTAVDNMNSMLGIIPKKENVEAQIQKSREQADFRRAQQEVQNYSNQINSIVAKSQADQLRVEGQGRGIPEVIIGGQQAQISREAAIEALPLQALLSAAQGNQEMAMQNLDSLRRMKTEEARIDYEYKSKVFDVVKEYATKSEQRQFDALKLDESRKYEEKQNLINTQSKLLASAVQQKAPSSVVQAINKATTIQEAISAAGMYGGDILERQIKQAQLANINSQIKERNADIAKKIADNKPIKVVNDPTKTVADNNIQTLQSIFQSSKVSAGNKTSIGNGLALAKAAQDLAEGNASGNFAGLYPLRGVVDFFTPEAFKRSSTVKNESLISALDLQTQFWASGAALSDYQTNLVQKMIPTKKDTDKAVKAKTNQLVNYMFSQTSSRLVTDGIDYIPAKVDMFETVDMLDKTSTAQQEELKALGLIQ